MLIEHNCPRCRGVGKVPFRGNSDGTCFRCKGAKVVSYWYPPEQALLLEKRGEPFRILKDESTCDSISPHGNRCWFAPHDDGNHEIEHILGEESWDDQGNVLFYYNALDADQPQISPLEEAERKGYKPQLTDLCDLCDYPYKDHINYHPGIQHGFVPPESPRIQTTLF
jgi:hypothetical protein